MANTLNALKHTMWMHPTAEYPNHGTMTENVVAPIPYAKNAQLIIPQNTPHGSEFNHIMALLRLGRSFEMEIRGGGARWKRTLHAFQLGFPS